MNKVIDMKNVLDVVVVEMSIPKLNDICMLLDDVYVSYTLKALSATTTEVQGVLKGSGKQTVKFNLFHNCNI